ncbi:hypothetical protein GOP47_0006414 [Adiantum capillus-veneris]|uniref:SAWADEE domain-containing protein n=1 Tax=Adiantum capillus-veneris TaxID=13818 RepID=A0A9D4ZKA1_ADICA|nr:hypothetical protein GOP47_0006414 [Adiantum capillus-veneris]
MSRRRERSAASRLIKESSCRSADAEKNSILTFGKRSAVDDAWYECDASAEKVQNPNAMELKEVLRINYCSTEVSESDTICTAEEARSRLRSPCKMVKDGICFQMHIGELVLATRTQGNGPFYEAHVKQIHRQRHSVTEACKCKFVLVWMDRTMKGLEWTASACKIRKINQGSIEGCQFLSKWLHQTESGPLEVYTSEENWISVLEREIDRVTVIVENLSRTEFISENLAAVDMHEVFDSILREESKTKAKRQGIFRRGSKRVVASSSLPITKSTSQDFSSRLSSLAACAALASKLPLNSPSPPNRKLKDKIKLEEVPCSLGPSSHNGDLQLPKPAGSFAAAGNPTSSNNISSAPKRPRTIRLTKLGKEVNGIPAKRSKRIINRAFEVPSSMLKETNPDKSAACRGKEGSVDSVKYNKWQLGNLIREGDVASEDSLKESSEQKGAGRMQRKRSKNAQPGIT